LAEEEVQIKNEKNLEVYDRYVMIVQEGKIAIR